MVAEEDPVVTNVAEAAELRLIVSKVSESHGQYGTTGFRRFKQIVRKTLLVARLHGVHEKSPRVADCFPVAQPSIHFLLNHMAGSVLVTC